MRMWRAAGPGLLGAILLVAVAQAQTKGATPAARGIRSAPAPSQRADRPVAARPLGPRSGGTGLTGEYYDNLDFTRLVMTRTDPAVDFDWSAGPPEPSMGQDTFSVRWTGQVEPLYTETYTFYTQTDDGVRLWVDGQLLVDQWVDQGATEWSGTIALPAGARVNLLMEYYQNGGGASAALLWESASQAKEIIPQSRLYPSIGASPTVGIATPSDGASFTSPATIVFSANAGDSDGSIARVEFDANDAKIGEDTTSPYSITMTDVPVGAYTLMARATDNVGDFAVSPRVTVTVACVVSIATAPSSFPSADVVWSDDAIPEGATEWGSWVWDTGQKASGTQSNTEPASGGMHQHGFQDAFTSSLYLATTDTLVAYVLINPCDPPQELMLQWLGDNGAWEHRAFWGADLLDWGTSGSGSRFSMGALPASGQWVRLEVPASAVDLAGRTAYGMAFTLVDGQAWFDRAGKTATCAPVVAPAPSPLPADTVWVEDALPSGASPFGTWHWDTSQKASGTKSHDEPGASRLRQHGFVDAWSGPLAPSATDNLVCYVLIDACDPPRELMLQWSDGGWEHRAFWGEDLIDWGTAGTESRVNMGPLPSTGEWIRLEVPASAVGLGGVTIGGVSFVLYDGHAWFDRSGKGTASGEPSLASLTLDPASVVGGGTSTGAATLTGAAPSGGATVALSSSDVSLATVPANVSVPQGATSATFTVTSFPVGADSSATITGTYKDVRTATLAITAGAVSSLSSVSVAPSSVAGGTSATGTVTLSAAAPAGGADVTLSSDNTAAATVPPSVTVASGATTATFTVTTQSVATTTSVTISATYAGTTQTATLTVSPLPATLLSIAVSPTSVPGGSSATGTATLTTSAPAGGVLIDLSSSNTSVATVPASIAIPEGATSGSFTVATLSVAATTSVSIGGTYAGTTRTATLGVYVPSAPSGELTENNAASWGSFASDSAATSVTDDSSFVKVGSKSIKFVTESGLDTGVVYPASGDAHWDLAGTNFLTFWAYAINSNDGGFQGSQPIIVLRTATGAITYEPASQYMFLDSWHLYQVALHGDSYWVRTDSGSADLADVLQIEIHHDTWGGGFTVYYDGLEFRAALPGDLAEGSAASWSSFAQDSAATSVADDSSVFKVGSKSVKFVTASGVDTGVRYPVSGDAHWNFGDADHLTFWAYAVNSNGGGFQGNQPVVVLKSPNGSFRYEAQGVLMSDSAWRLYQVPLAGGGPWILTTTGSPTLADVVQLEIHHDTWGAGFTVYYDGLSFGGAASSQLVVSSVGVSPTTTTGSYPATGTVTLNSAAPAGGAAVSLTSSNTSAATVPPSVTIPAGSTSATFTVTTSAVAANTALTISAAYGGSSATVSLSLTPMPDLSFLRSNPHLLPPVMTADCQIMLTAPAPPDGATIQLSSTVPSAVAIPSSITIPAGATSADFTVTPLTTGIYVNILGTYRGVTRSSWIAILEPASLTALTVSPATVVAGQRVTIGISLFGGLSGASVDLSSSHPAVVPVPSAVTVPAFARGGTLTVQTGSVSTATPVTISGTFAGVTKTAVLTVTPAPALSAFTISPTSVQQYGAAVGTVMLNGPAPAGGVVVSLSKTSSAIGNLQSQVVIPAYLRSATFPIYTSGVTSSTDATVTASYAGGSLDATLNVTPSPVPLSISFAPSSVVGGQTTTGTVTINGVSATATPLTLSAADPAATVPSSVIVPANQTAVTFTVTTAAVDLPKAVTISAAAGGTTRTAPLRVTPETEVAALTLSETSTVKTVSIAGTVTLTAPPRAGGELVGLESSNPAAATVPATVLVPAGQSSASFTVTPTPSLGATATATIWATLGEETRGVDLEVTPVSEVRSIQPSFSGITGGASGSVTVRLNGPAPAGGAVIALQTSDPAVLMLPATVTNPEGAYSVSFNAQSSPVSEDTVVGIAATYDGQTLAVPCTVRRPVLVRLDLVSQGGIWVGQPFTLRLTISGPAPAGGLTYSVAYYSGGATVSLPTTVTMPAGASTVDFDGTAISVSGPACFASVSVYVHDGPVWIVTSLYVLDLRPISVTLDPPGVVGGSPSTATIAFNGALPSAQSVTLTSSNPAVASVPASISVSTASAQVPVTTFAVGADTAVTITATTQRASASGTLAVAAPGGPTLSSLTVNPTTVSAGSMPLVTAALTGPARPGGAMVAFSSSSPATASVPSTALIPEGSTGVSFAIPTNFSGTVTLTAAYGGVTRSATLTVTAAGLGTLSSLTLNPASVTGGSSSTGTVTLTYAAPAGGSVVALGSSDPSAAVPSNVTIPAGSTSATFGIATVPVATAKIAIISAEFRGVTRTASLTINVAAAGHLSSLALSPTAVQGGTSSTGTITMTSAAPAGGWVVSLSSSSSSAQVPATVTVAQGASSATFTATTSTVASATDATITATFGSVTASAMLSILGGAVVKGLAPGAALPGDTNLVLYAEGVDAATDVSLAGPVYSLSDPNTALCNLGAEQCPTTNPAASLGSGGTLAFALSSAQATGYYFVRSRSSSGSYSSNGAWLRGSATRAPSIPSCRRRSTGRPRGSTRGRR